MTPWNWWHMGPGWGWGGMLIGMIVMLLFWGGVIALAFFAIRWLSRRDIGDPRRDASREDETPLEILKKRYARGEISREEYLNMKQDLRDLET